ncbi:MAG: superoxide dismutase family protein [Oscillatoria sp. PMC 1068.18]|nr:superoxide dismutase family protein [Oscillatoria sp. PMC 1076.18]MEC4987655.1 superoxide dismutase family protein [Oscillatoria sp. PMC 1068.18]
MKKTKIFAIALCLTLFTWLYGCSNTNQAGGDNVETPEVAQTTAPQTAVAVISSTSETPTVIGEVNLTQTASGLDITANISDAPPGKHGFHIHENGSCADGGQAAGGHFNPEETQHGYLPEDGLNDSHAGDLGNIEIAEDGTGTLDLTLAGLTLEAGKYPVGDLAFIMHEKPDDFGQPTGNAGGRIGCGTIDILGS